MVDGLGLYHWAFPIAHLEDHEAQVVVGEWHPTAKGSDAASSVPSHVLAKMMAKTQMGVWHGEIKVGQRR